MNEEILQRLVDLYAERELPAELEDPLEMAAMRDANLRRDMATLRTTVETVRRDPGEVGEFAEDTRQRILMRLHAAGIEAVEVESVAPVDSRFQYALPYAPTLG